LTKQFGVFLLAGLAVVAVFLFVVFSSTKGAHVDLTGEILKTRVLSVSDGAASIVVVDFRVTNPSNVNFVLLSAQLLLQTASGETVEGAMISKPDMENVFAHEKLLGPKYNDILSIKDNVLPHATVDRMSGARFEFPEAKIGARKGMRLRIDEMDGVVGEIGEKKK
jgi:hypothetical protein